MTSVPVRLAVLALAGVATGCSSVRRPEVRAVNVRIEGIDFNGIGVVFNVDVYNPYPVRLRTPKLRYGIDIAETEFVRSEQLTEVDLPAGSVGAVPLPVRMEYVKLWGAIEKLKGANKIPYRLHGAVVATALDRTWDVPLEHEGTLPLLRPPAFSAPRVRVAEVSLTSAKIVLDVEVRNPNVFGMGLENVTYDLALGTIPVASVRATTLGELGAQAAGRLSLAGEVTAAGALLQLARGQSLGVPRMTCSGAVQTPYGQIPLPSGLAGIEKRD